MSVTTYQIQVYAANGDLVFNMNVYDSPTGMDDATCLGLVETLRDFAWPAVMRPMNIMASKTVNSPQGYTCAVNATPPTFS
jgi:hypothetical protein